MPRKQKAKYFRYDRCDNGNTLITKADEDLIVVGYETYNENGFIRSWPLPREIDLSAGIYGDDKPESRYESYRGVIESAERDVEYQTEKLANCEIRLSNAKISLENSKRHLDDKVKMGEILDAGPCLKKAQEGGVKGEGD